MKKLFLIFLLISIAVATLKAQLVPNLGGQRAGISALQFLKIGVGGRGAALGESMVAIANDVSALYWNPAGLTLMDENAVMISHTEWLVDLKHDFLGAMYKLSSSDAVGVSLISLRTDDMPVTTETQPFGTGEYFRYADMALGVSYARRMTDKFSLGATVRYVRESLHMLKIQTVLIDLGTHYSIGFGGLRFGVVVSNFGSDVSPTGEVTLFDGSTIESFQSFSPPTVFKIGFAMEVFRNEQHTVTGTVQLNHPNDNAEQVRLGAEYEWNKWVFLRAGLKRTIGESILGKDTKSADDYSFGLGLRVPLSFSTANFDYSYTNFNQLGAAHRISLSLSY